MANTDYTYDQVKNGTGYFCYDTKVSPSVRRLQKKLMRNGFLSVGTPDGQYGNATKNAVITLQSEVGLTPDGIAGQKTLIALDAMDKEPVVELYGRELTCSELLNSYSTMNQIEALARCIYGEDSEYYEGQQAVAEEIYNRKNSLQYNFGEYCPVGVKRSWKAVVFSPSQYAVMSSSDAGDLVNSRCPDQYSSEWKQCVALAELLVNGGKPNVLGARYFHLSKDSSYPASSYNCIQIPNGKGNKFFNRETTKF